MRFIHPSSILSLPFSNLPFSAPSLSAVRPLLLLLLFHIHTYIYTLYTYTHNIVYHCNCGMASMMYQIHACHLRIPSFLSSSLPPPRARTRFVKRVLMMYQKEKSPENFFFSKRHVHTGTRNLWCIGCVDCRPLLAFLELERRRRWRRG